MALSLKPAHLRHYKDLALLLFKYGRRDLVDRAGLSELLPQEPQRDERAEAAVGGGAALAVTILANDIRAKRRAKT